MEIVSLGGRAVSLREGKASFQTSAALWPHPMMGKASGINPGDKICSCSCKRPSDVRSNLVPTTPVTTPAPSIIGRPLSFSWTILVAWRGGRVLHGELSISHKNKRVLPTPASPHQCLIS